MPRIPRTARIRDGHRMGECSNKSTKREKVYRLHDNWKTWIVTEGCSRMKAKGQERRCSDLCIELTARRKLYIA